jgi:oxygen-independent coproporphyrinogen-3 oxidase
LETAERDPKDTSVGNYFIANYPPFSFWTKEQVPAVDALLARASPEDVPLGLYLHIPFCRKRCDFCYFKVYTDKNSKDIKRYVDALLAELARYAAPPYLAGRSPRFVYFGGGTPSYLSADQLGELFQGIGKIVRLEEAEEVAFECEPGTLQEPKIAALRDLGVTRLSLGVENFDPDILELNNRAHRAQEIYRTYEYARKIGFPQINIDLIAGMVGETDANWRRCIEQTVRLAPDSVTIYQMEVPYNTTLFQRMKDKGHQVAPVADWDTKRRWTREAFAGLEAAGYEIGSAYTAKRGAARFVYRDALWRGADLLGLGVSSFSHVGGVHFQNEHEFESYLGRLERGQRPVCRALALSDEERLIREFVLQMKLGHVEFDYFRRKFGVDPRRRFGPALERHRDDGWLELDEGGLRTTRAGLLQVDLLLPAFFKEEHQGARYA